MKKLMIILVIFLGHAGLNAQIDVRGKIKSQADNRANSRVDQGINKGMDATEDAIIDVFKKKKKTGSVDPQSAEKPTDDNSKTKSKNEKKSADDPALAAYSKFDFIPGERVIFYEDFSQDAVGDFPALWNTNGSAEVVTTNLYPGNWMRFIGSDAVWTDELLKLPENYTIEYDIIPIVGEEDGMAGYHFRLLQSINSKSFDHGAIPGKAGFDYSLEYYGRSGYRAYTNNPDGDGQDLSGFKEGENYYQKLNEKKHISFWVQKSRVRLYMDENKFFDLPKAFDPSTVKMDRIRFEEGAFMISNIRIAVGAPDMRNKLMTEGKLVTYGIYFDVNKDKVKPESYATLKEIATILNEVPNVKVKIAGHTDADGQDAANLDLSKRRAESVKAELAKSFGVDASRLSTDGLGESQPVAPNDTPVNKALNRRVEFIKL